MGPEYAVPSVGVIETPEFAVTTSASATVMIWPGVVTAARASCLRVTFSVKMPSST